MKTKRVYLTIDDGPSKDFLDKVEYLHKAHIPAVFFCLGEKLLKYEKDVIHAIRLGFLIGNHAFNHTHFSDMSLEACKKSIQMTDDILESLYERSGVRRPLKVFRFPHFDQGGEISGEAYESRWIKPESEWDHYALEEKRWAIQGFLRELGYRQPKFQGIKIDYFVEKRLLDVVDVRCTYDQMEYFLGNKSAPYGMEKEEAILGRIEEDVPYQGRSLNCADTSDIILIHDDERTTSLFYKIIRRYQEKHFVFLSIDQ